MNPILTALPILIPWIGALVIMGLHRTRVIHGVAVGTAILNGIGALLLIPLSAEHAQLLIPAGQFWGTWRFSPDSLSALLSLIAAIIGALAVIFSVDYMHGTNSADLKRYYGLVLLFIGGMSGLVLTDHLLLLFFFWELVALCSFALIAYYPHNPAATAGGVKALVITQIGGIGLLIGVLAVGGTAGDFSFKALHSSALTPTLKAAVGFGFLIAAAAKSAQFPFHTWLPDAMEAPTPISALIHAATMVNSGVYLMLRFYPVFVDIPGWTNCLMLIGVLSVLIGGGIALLTDDLKRVLAGSTISQLGYLFFAVGAGASAAAEFHLLNHAIFKGLLFLGAGAVIHALHTRDMRRMGGVRREMPLVFATFLIGSLALVGVPIFNGFWSKELILEAAVSHAPGWIIGALLVGVGMTALYTYRMVRQVFWGRAQNRAPIHEAPLGMKIALISLAGGVVLSPLCLPDLGGVITEVVSAPVTLLALGIILVGAGIGWLRLPISISQRAIQALDRGLGLTPLNRISVQLTSLSAEGLRGLHTGVLSLNLMAVVGALVLLLIILLVGGAL